MTVAKAVRFYEVGGPEVLKLEEVTVGRPGPGEVYIRHHAIGCNFADTYFRSGYYPVQPPCGIGVEGAGEVFEAQGPVEQIVGMHVVKLEIGKKEPGGDAILPLVEQR